MNGTPAFPQQERTFFQKVQLLFFFLGTFIFFASLLFDVLDGVIYYEATQDVKPLLTATIGKIVANDYILYLSIESLKTPGLSKEAVDSLKYKWIVTLTLFLLIHIFLFILLLFKIPLEKKYGILLFLLALILLAFFELLYVFLISHKLIIPYVGFFKSFTPTALRLLFTTAGTTSIESVILETANVTVIH